MVGRVLSSLSASLFALFLFLSPLPHNNPHPPPMQPTMRPSQQMQPRNDPLPASNLETPPTNKPRFSAPYNALGVSLPGLPPLPGVPLPGPPPVPVPAVPGR